MDATRIPFVTQASQPSEDEEDQCQADSQPSFPPASPNPVKVPPLASSKPRNIRENNSEHLVQSGLFGMRVVPSNKMISVRQFKKKTGSKVMSALDWLASFAVLGESSHALIFLITGYSRRKGIAQVQQVWIFLIAREVKLMAIGFAWHGIQAGSVPRESRNVGNFRLSVWPVGFLTSRYSTRQKRRRMWRPIECECCRRSPHFCFLFP